MSQLLKSVQIFTNPRGAHNTALAYAKMDEVQYETSLYVASDDIPAGVSIADPRWVCKLDNSAAYAAENERAAFYDGFASQLAEIGKFEAVNKVVNGSFDQEIDGWAVNGPYVIDTTNYVAGEQSLKVSVVNQSPTLYQQFNCLIGSKIYYAGWIRRVSGTGILFDALPKGAMSGALSIAMDDVVFNSMDAGRWTRYSSIATATNDGFRIFVGRTAPQTAEYNVDGIIALDLTAIFGAGNEPTAAQMDAILARFPNSWFDGTVNLAQADKSYKSLVALKNQLDEKTGYGIVSGLGVTAHGTPDMAVAVAAGVFYKSDGSRHPISAVASLPATPADATNPRIDIVYVSSADVVTYLAGAAGATPAAPATPTGGTLLAEIRVAANVTAITTSMITSRARTLSGEAWIKPTLLNAWTNYGTPFLDVAYYKDSNNIVHLRGVAKAGTIASIFGLPAGYRPIGRIDFVCASDSSASVTRVNIHVALVPSTVTGLTWISLDGITYRAEA